MIRQPFTRSYRKVKFELARNSLGRFDNGQTLGSNVCPVCSYRGRFLSRSAATGKRRRAQCPRCGSLERHRIQHLVYERLRISDRFGGSKVLEIAPDAFSTRYLTDYFETVITADLLRTDVNLRLDLTSLPFPDHSFDAVVASHVLEHIREDQAAVCELARILKPTGCAVLPVPIVNKRTVEYPEANRFEDYHVRAPGEDYYDRYEDFFSRVEKYRSSTFEEVFQVCLLEDRSVFPSKRFPLRDGTPTKSHDDVVAVCFHPKTSRGKSVHF